MSVRFAFETGKVAGPTAPYATIKDKVLSPGKVSWSRTSDAEPEAKVYFATDTPNTIVEIIGWQDIR